MNRTPREHKLPINGVRLHCLDWGDPAAPPLLMVHGLTRNAHAFDRVAARYADRYRYRCLVPDMRGRGHSDWAPPETYSIAQYAADVLALLAALEVDRVHWLGTSMGGIIAMTFAAEHAGRLQSLVLNDIGPQVEPAGSARIGRHLAHAPAAFPTLDALLDYEIGRFPWLGEQSREALAEAYRHNVRRTDEGGWAFHFDPRITAGRPATPEAREAQSRTCRAGLQAYRGPLLVLRGAESDLLSPAGMDAIRALRPDLRYVEVPGVGHAPDLTEPAAVAALDAFYG